MTFEEGKEKKIINGLSEDSEEMKEHHSLQALEIEGLSHADRMGLTSRARKLLDLLLTENPVLGRILESSSHPDEAAGHLRKWVWPVVEANPVAQKLFREEVYGSNILKKVTQQQIAAIRLLDYIDHGGMKVEDLNLRGEITENHPVKFLWLAARFNRGGLHPNFFIDMIELFRQFRGKQEYLPPNTEQVKSWMKRHPSGLEPEIQAIRAGNRDRILEVFIRKMDDGEIEDNRYFFEPGTDPREKMKIARKWWNERLFHLRFAARDPGMVNDLLDQSLDAGTLARLQEAFEREIPIFINPYYLSLLIINPPGHLVGADQPIRDYIFCSRQLLDEFGHIVAWEKEDEVEPGKPNAAGWILPTSSNVHRRYPEVAILIPDTIGRSCGGLCVSCQRMYDFQSGHLNFDLDRLKPKETWWERLESLMEYFENDAQLQDILITGGDALMSTDRSLGLILDSVYRMAARKKKANQHRAEGEKFAEISRVRLGTRLPVYLPMRVTDELVELLAGFRERSMKIGIRQFVIQTHYESALEVTVESAEAIRKLLLSGWIITNQQVFTATASRRGHTAKLRQTLNDIGVLPYYTFTVKGYMENYHNFAPSARSLQESAEEKVIGIVPDELMAEIRTLPENSDQIREKFREIRLRERLPFLATDRNMLNLPGVGKSQTFRTVGITRYGRRILLFDHDVTRNHSPITEKMGKVVIIESKPIYEYLLQLKEMGENLHDYRGLFGYSIGFTERRSPLFKYPTQPAEISADLTNFSD